MTSGAPARSAMAQVPDRPNWLPQFCSLPTLFAVMIVAELVALVIVIDPAVPAGPLFRRLGIVSVYVQWLALLVTVVLCSLRGVFGRLPAATGYAFAWGLAVLATALGRDVKGKVSVVAYAAAIPLALANSWLAFGLFVLVAVMWLVPDRRIEKTLTGS